MVDGADAAVELLEGLLDGRRVLPDQRSEPFAAGDPVPVCPARHLVHVLAVNQHVVRRQTPLARVLVPAGPRNTNK